MVAHKANGNDFTLDYREKAPSRAYRNMYLDDSGNIIENMSLDTRAASGVPGSVEGILKVWKDHGSGNISRFLNDMNRSTILIELPLQRNIRDRG